MRAWLRRTALVVGFGLLVCLVASIVVGFRSHVDLMGIVVRIEVLGLLAPGTLAVLLALYTDPTTAALAIRRRLMGSPRYLGYPIPPLDQKTGRVMVRQDDSLLGGGAVLIALGVAVVLLA